LNHPVWKQDYPYRAVDFNAGLGLYSKFPLSHAQLRQGRNQAPFLKADLQLTDRQIPVVLGHPSMPTSPENWMRQTRQFADWGQHPPAILMGDMNTAPWMPHVVRATGQGVLRDSALGWGIQPTWAVDNPLWALPLDQVWIGKSFKVLDRHIGPEVGSDHRPVVVELGLQPVR
jgi:endonuclease/exonuclease/phosphatase (EEP) superfamily protein YafD